MGPVPTEEQSVVDAIAISVERDARSRVGTFEHSIRWPSPPIEHEVVLAVLGSLARLEPGGRVMRPIFGCPSRPLMVDGEGDHRDPT